MKKYHDISNIEFEEDTLKLLVDEKILQIDLKTVSEKLLYASDIERNTFVLSPSGYGIHWPIIDEDLSIDGLLGVKHAPRQHMASGI